MRMWWNCFNLQHIAMKYFCFTRETNIYGHSKNVICALAVRHAIPAITKFVIMQMLQHSARNSSHPFQFAFIARLLLLNFFLKLQFNSWLFLLVIGIVIMKLFVEIRHFDSLVCFVMFGLDDCIVISLNSQFWLVGGGWWLDASYRVRVLWKFSPSTKFTCQAFVSRRCLAGCVANSAHYSNG